ncbi:MAG: hypothetical protein ABEJ87_06080 [Candidatus Nanohalobium sp.]
MSKFWGAAGTLVVIGIALILLGNQTAAGINFTDLETACRYNRKEASNIGVHPNGKRLTFEGQFPINNTESDLSYTYKVSDGEILLNVKAEDGKQPTDYVNQCLGLAEYRAHTDVIPGGRYIVEVQHNGKKVKEKVISFR